MSFRKSPNRSNNSRFNVNSRDENNNETPSIAGFKDKDDTWNNEQSNNIFGEGRNSRTDNQKPMSVTGIKFEKAKKQHSFKFNQSFHS